MRFAAIAVIAILATGLAAQAQSSDAPFTVAETGARYTSLSDALGAIGGGKGTVLIAPGTYRQCAVQESGDVTLRATTPGTAIFDGVVCEAKAALVLRGRRAVVDGLVFQNLRVPDGNGAGIRLENGDLTISESLFRNSEEGILTADYKRGTVSIDRSTFQHLGRCDRDLSCAHSIYIGGYGKLIVTRSRFEMGDGGHYVKSRAPIAEIRDNSFDDSKGRLTNYMIDLPNGATGVIADNDMVQGRDKDNWSAFITVAPEGKEQGSQGLSIVNNKAGFAPGVSRRTAFVADWSGDALSIGANLLAPGIARFERR
jgi:hypothetical protein